MKEEFRRLAPAARVFWGLRGVVPALVVGLVGAVVLAALDLTAIGVAVLAVGVVVAVWWWWLCGRRYRAWGYAEGDRELIVRHGILITRLSVVPYGRMQFIDVFQGPFDRIFKVATVKLHTAAAATDALIPFVNEDEATRLRQRLTELGESHAAGL